ncbi:MAG: hypothetical protein EOP84_13765 [Verrucomicrobiaceae bacterium]|nr:MAG: hypothetical protein EOP84_13765 [Verrucomicrobiaceae bacterium]
MTRTKKIGYFQAALTTAWFSTMALDGSQLVNGVLGDAGCATISLILALPLSWLAAMIIGFPLFPSMPEHFIGMSIMGVVVIANGLVVGYFVDWFLSWSGLPDRSGQEKKIKMHNKANDCHPH